MSRGNPGILLCIFQDWQVQDNILIRLQVLESPGNLQLVRASS